jgi:thymidine phosphorylase
MHPIELIRKKRDGHTLSASELAEFVHGLHSRNAEQRWSEGQVAAFAMATLWRGMRREETVALTLAMAGSGERLSWRGIGDGPLLDKHSSGGVGDKVSLLLAPIVAACGGIVPMLSGRGLGHTGGTLDKLASLPGYAITPSAAQLKRALREAGCAIFGASAQIAPADRRLYAVRDVTATVESVPLITASILSKKLAAGVQGLVLDVKVGNGAFCQTLPQARALARSLVAVSREAGLPAQAQLSDMNQVLGRAAGNALEVQECIEFFAGSAAQREPRLLALTLALAARMLLLGGLARSLQAGQRLAEQALDSGAAAERFEAMVAALGGPAQVLRRWQAPQAPVVQDVPASRAGTLLSMDTRSLGMAVVELGGGRRQAEDRIDPRVGFSHVLPLGQKVARGEPLLRLHAADAASARRAATQVQAAMVIGPGKGYAAPALFLR